ncbi:hypothetical protein [Glutamicibacter sp. TV12E]|uniref:hypothetical protein n=1 Tax=Glutamicibacter sp. TV12E TaxID=3446362 RepID=UPI0040334515
MKNLSAVIPVNKNIVKDLLTKSDLAGYDINASPGEAPTVDGVRLFQPEITWVNFEIPADKITDVANIEGETSIIMDDLRQAAKKYLEANEERPAGYITPSNNN